MSGRFDSLAARSVLYRARAQGIGIFVNWIDSKSIADIIIHHRFPQGFSNDPNSPSNYRATPSFLSRDLFYGRNPDLGTKVIHYCHIQKNYPDVEDLETSVAFSHAMLESGPDGYIMSIAWKIGDLNDGFLSVNAIKKSKDLKELILT